MKRRMIGATVLAALAIGGLAFGGARSTWEVYVDTTSHYAQGSLGSARNSADSMQYIGCSAENDYIYCSARNVSGTWVHCDAYSSAMAATVRAIGSDGFVQFYWTPGSPTSGTCSSVQVNHYSYLAPKAP